MTFEDVCAECLLNKELVREWNRLTGHLLGVPRSPIEAVIDKACGYNPYEKAMPEFISFVWEFIWIPLIGQSIAKQKDNTLAITETT
jgi:hypothetical protein